MAAAAGDNRQLNSIVKDCHDYSSTTVAFDVVFAGFWWFGCRSFTMIGRCSGWGLRTEEMPRSLTGCNLTDENAELQRKGSGCMHAIPNNNRRMRFYCLTKSQEGGTKQRKTVLKLCRGDRSNLAVKCLLVGIVERWCRMRRGERSEWSFFWSIRDFIDMASCW